MRTYFEFITLSIDIHRTEIIMPTTSVYTWIIIINTCKLWLGCTIYIYVYSRNVPNEGCKTRRICYQPFGVCRILKGTSFEYAYRQDFCTLITNYMYNTYILKTIAKTPPQRGSVLFTVTICPWSRGSRISVQNLVWYCLI